MRILLWHGYLLGGTGSNVYTRSVAREWSRAGHDVVVVCQEPHPERYDIGGAKVFRPNIGGLLPSFVLDRYEGIEAKLLQDFTRAERERYVALNATALCAQMPADVVFANHVLLGAAVGWASGMPFAVKAHGSELEYSMRGNEELAMWGRECLAAAEAVFVGSAHIRSVLEEVVGHVDRVYEVPPGVDVEEFRPSRSREESLAASASGSPRGRSQPGQRQRAAARRGQRGALRRVLCQDEPTVLYFGKLLHNKGVHVLLEALRSVDARARDRRLRRLPAGARVDRPAGHAVSPVRSNIGTSCTCSRSPMSRSCRRSFPKLSEWSPRRRRLRARSPLVARHSGLAEVAEGLEAEYPVEHRHLASFVSGDAADLAAKLAELLALSSEARA